MRWNVILTLKNKNGEYSEMVYQKNGDSFAAVQAVMAIMSNQDTEWYTIDKITIYQISE